MASARCRLRRWASVTCAVKERSSGSEWTPRLPRRPISPCSTSTVARASSSARWFGVVAAWKNGASVLSLQFGTSSRVSTRRASTAVSTTANAGHGIACRAQAALRKPTSNGALCATSTAPRANSRNAGSTTSIGGDPATMKSVMPVSTLTNGLIAMPGFTRVWNSPSTSPPQTLTAPISVMPSPLAAAPPVVSRSTTTNVVARSGSPSSSRHSWAPEPVRCAVEVTPAR